MTTRIDLQYQVQGVLARLHGGTGNTAGFASEMLILPFVNDSGGELSRNSLVARTAASPLLKWTEDVGQSIVGVVVGRFNADGTLEDVNPDNGQTAAVCVSGRVTILTTTTADRWDYLRASDTTGTAEPSSTLVPGVFGIVLYNIDSTHCQALIDAVLSIGTSSGTLDHGALSGLADDDHSAYVTVIGGGEETLSTVGASGTSETIDLTDGNVHDLTLDNDCTLTLTGATVGVACSLTLLLRQDGTGGWTVTWPGSVEWPGGVAPTLATDPDSVDVFTLFTLDGGTVWYGFQAGSGSSVSPATTVTDETTWGITPAVGTDLEYARQDHTHGSPEEPIVTAPVVGELLISEDHSTPLVFADILQNDDQDDFLYAEA